MSCKDGFGLCVWVRDDFLLDGSSNPMKGVVSGNFSGTDGFWLIFLVFFVFSISETM